MSNIRHDQFVPHNLLSPMADETWWDPGRGIYVRCSEEACTNMLLRQGSDWESSVWRNILQVNWQSQCYS
jgi:hypothetical protein